MSLASVALQASSLSFKDLIEYQAQHGPLVLYQPIGFITSLFALLAKLEKRPFDLPHAKQEVVAGWLTEYSGRSLAYLRLFNDLSMTWGISLLTSFYLGGPLGPGYEKIGPLAGFLWFGFKALALSFLLTFISASMARFKVSGLARVFWGILYPLVFIQLLIAFLFRWLV